MTHRKATELVPYTAIDMYALVADIERYPEFLKWCPALRVVRDETINGEGQKIADMVVAYKIFREQFRCRLLLDPGRRSINVDFISGPFRRLCVDWAFEALDAGSNVHFEIDFELRSSFLQSAAHAFFERKFTRMSDAFVERAHEIHGATSPEIQAF